MKRTTLFVPETLERELRLVAQREGRPVASLVREALAEYVASRRATRGLPSFTGLFDSGRPDVAERHEALLFDRLSPHGENGAVRRRRSIRRKR